LSIAIIKRCLSGVHLGAPTPSTSPTAKHAIFGNAHSVSALISVPFEQSLELEQSFEFLLRIEVEQDSECFRECQLATQLFKERQALSPFRVLIELLAFLLGSTPLLSLRGSLPLRFTFGALPLSVRFGPLPLCFPLGSLPLRFTFDALALCVHFGSLPLGLGFGSSLLLLFFLSPFSFLLGPLRRLGLGLLLLPRLLLRARLLLHRLDISPRLTRIPPVRVLLQV